MLDGERRLINVTEGIRRPDGRLQPAETAKVSAAYDPVHQLGITQAKWWSSDHVVGPSSIYVHRNVAISDAAMVAHGSSIRQITLLLSALLMLP